MKRSRLYSFLKKKIVSSPTFDFFQAISFFKDNLHKPFLNYKLSISIRNKKNSKNNFSAIKGEMIIPNCNSSKIFLIKDGLGEEIIKKISSYEEKVLLIDLDNFISLLKKKKLKKMGFFKLIVHEDSINFVDKFKKELTFAKFYPNKKKNLLLNTENLFREIEDFNKKLKKFSSDKDGNTSFNLGSSKFNPDELFENYSVILDKLSIIKPISWKGNFFNKIVISTNNSPGIILKINK